MFILIITWFAVSQSYNRPNEYYPQVVMQGGFQSRAACEAAATATKQMLSTDPSGKRIQTTCVPDWK